MNFLGVLIFYTFFHVISLSEKYIQEFDLWTKSTFLPSIQYLRNLTVLPNERPLISIVLCDKTSLVKYKYTGRTDDNKLFDGVGALEFSRAQHPPSSYNYGLKSGKCLRLADEGILRIEGNFKNGFLSGEALVYYENSTWSQRVYYNNRPTNAVTLKYKMIEREKKLFEISNTHHKWRIENQIYIFTSYSSLNEGILWSRSANETKLALKGTLDFEFFLRNSVSIHLTGFTYENGMALPNIEEKPDSFLGDFNILKHRFESFEKMKLVQFFDEVIREENDVFKMFDDVRTNIAFAKRPENEILHSIQRIQPNIFRMHNYHDGDSVARFEGTIHKEYIVPVGRGKLSFLSSSESFQSYDSLSPFFLSSLLRQRNASKLISSLSGTFNENGELEGEIDIRFTDSSLTKGFAVQNTFHGILREFDPVSISVFPSRYPFTPELNEILGKANNYHELNKMSLMSFGAQSGIVWYFHLQGNVVFMENESLGIYIHNDYESCYNGTFYNGQLISGQYGTIVTSSYSALRYSSIFKSEIWPSITCRSKESKNSIIFNYGVSESKDLIDPLLTDVIEDKFVYVNQSSVCSEEGLFARRRIEKNTLFSYFAGIRYSPNELEALNNFEDEYRMFGKGDEIIFLPKEIGRNSSKYKASLGHKINHAFQNWNCLFVEVHHPRFGNVLGAKATSTIDPNSEILCHYNLEFSKGNSWYQETWRRELDQDRNEHPTGFGAPKGKTLQKIQPMLSDGELYTEFVKYAIDNLKLNPLS